MTAPLPPELSEKFDILGVLGEGGMGVVYKARQRLIERIVALKLLPPHNENDEFTGRFVQEARLASQLLHSNVVVLFDFGFAGTTPYIVFECVDGPSVRQVLKQGVPKVELALDIVSQTCDGLTAAHARNIVHRDLKPENLLMSAEGTVKIADFGIAKDQAGQGFETATGVLVGTPSYMAPEQCAGSDVSAATDIYALGVVLYELLCGNVPFRGKSVLETLRMHAEAMPPPLRDVHSAVRTLVTKALAKRPADRFRSAAAFREELDHVVQMLGHEDSVRRHTMTRSFAAESRPPEGRTAREVGASGTQVGAMGEGSEALHRARREVTPVAPVSRHISLHTPRNPEEQGGGLGTALALIAAVGLGAILMSTRQRPAQPGGSSSASASVARSPRGFARLMRTTSLAGMAYARKADRLRKSVLLPLVTARGADAARLADEYRARENDPAAARLAGCLSLVLSGLEESARTELHQIADAAGEEGLDPPSWLLMNASLELLALHHLEAAPPVCAAAEAQEVKRGSALKPLLRGIGALKRDGHDQAARAFAEFGGLAIGRPVPAGGAWERGSVIDAGDASPAWFFLGLAQLAGAEKAAEPAPAIRAAAGSLSRYLAGLNDMPCAGAARGLLRRLNAAGFLRGLPPTPEGIADQPQGPAVQKLLTAAYAAVDRVAPPKRK